MSEHISFSTPPGYLLEPTTVTLQLSERVTALQFSVDGAAPAISKYIAYDTLNPPNPFIAVTQDGKGNVVYDGGFPKFYDSAADHIRVGETTFGDLRPAWKYMYNAARFIENKTKRAIGNNKILVVGDSLGSYRVDVAGGSHFKNNFTRFAIAAGYDLTIKTRASWGGSQIDYDLEELEQYCCVIMMSSQSHSSASIGYITDEAILAMVAYRENGNGLMFITDHGSNIATLEDAQAGNYGSGFFVTANRVITHFGAWFSGNVNRTGINVGFLKQTYGDHPLYNGLTDEERIPAGGSESRVFVAPFEPILPHEVEPFEIGNGETLIQVAAVLDTGEVVTYRAQYNVVDVKISIGNDEQMRDNGQLLDIGLNNHTTIEVLLDSPDMAVFEGLTGTITINDQVVGAVNYSQGTGVDIDWVGHDGSARLVNNGDRIATRFDDLGLISTVTIRRFQPPIAGQLSLAVIYSLMRSYKPQLTDNDRLRDLMHEIGQRVPWREFQYVQNIPHNLRELVRYFTNSRDYVEEPDLWWSFYSAGGVFTTNDVTELIDDSDYWTLDTEHGWHKDTYTYTAGSSVTREEQFTTVPEDLLPRLREISAIFTSYYNDIPRGLGRNLIYVGLDDGTELRLGTDDAWTDAAQGQNIYRDISTQGGGRNASVTVDVINERFTLVIPEGRYVTAMSLSSIGSSQVGIEYPFSKRGMKDFRLTFV